MKKFTLLKLLVLSIFIGTICFTSCSNPASSGNSGSSNSSEQPADPKTTVPPNPGTTDPANPGTTDPANPGTTDPANPGTTDPTNPGTADPTNPGTTDPTNPGTTDPSNPGTTDPSNPGTTNPTNPGTTDPSNPGTTDPVTPQEPEYTITTNCTGCTIALSAEKAKAGTSITYTITCQVQYILKDNSAVSIKDAAGNSISTNGSSFVMPESDVTISVTAVKLPDDYGKAKNITYAFAGTTLACQWDYDGPEDFISKYIVKDTSQGVTFPANSNYLIVKNFETSQERTLTIYVENVLGDLIEISDAFKIQKSEVSISDIEAYYTKYNDFFVTKSSNLTSHTETLYREFGNICGVASSMTNLAMQGQSRARQINDNNAQAVISYTASIGGYAGSIQGSQNKYMNTIQSIKNQLKNINEVIDGLGQDITEIKTISEAINSLDVNSKADIELLNSKITEKNKIIGSIPEKQKTIKELLETIIDDFTVINDYGNSFIKTANNLSSAANNAVYFGEKIGLTGTFTKLKDNAVSINSGASGIVIMSSSMLSQLKQFQK